MTLVKAEGREIYLGQETFCQRCTFSAESEKGVYLIPSSDLVILLA